MAFLELTQECLDAAEGKLPEPVVGPDGKKARPPQRIQIFQNKFIERWFAQAHPITPGIWFGPFVAYGLYRGTLDHGFYVLPAFALGVLITSLIEYSLHRFIFHFTPKNKEQRLQSFLLHGYHHEFPNDAYRLVLPPIGIWPVAALLGVIWWFAFGSYFWPVYAGSAAGYVAYDWMHYYTHYFNPKRNPGRFIKRYHMLHHHDSPEQRYGITSPLWDHVFGTYLGLKSMARQGGRHTPPASSSASEEA